MADAAAKPPPPPAPPTGPEEEVSERRTIRDYYIILRERLWIALRLAVLVSVTFCYRKMQVHPVYFARASMQFEKPETVVNTQGVTQIGVQSEVDINTAIEILRSGMMRARVTESF